MKREWLRQCLIVALIMSVLMWTYSIGYRDGHYGNCREALEAIIRGK